MRSVQTNGSPASFFNSNRRLHIWYALLMLVAAIFVARLFYLQVIRHDYYQKQARSGQLKEYTVQPERGVIEAHDGEAIVPIVLNEKLYTVFADPKYITDAETYADKVADIIGGDRAEYTKQMQRDDTRYVVLAKRLPKTSKTKLDNLELKGLGTREESYRTYPQGILAAQVLGFVDAEGKGRYGIEEALNTALSGKPGLLKAITDASGIPLVANEDNVQIEPQAGQRTVLTIDVTMQRQLEDILKQGIENAKSQSGSAIIMDPNTGAVKAVANYPSFDPANYFKQEDARAFSNAAFSSPLEPGSVMKPLTAAAALNLGVVSRETTYYDPGFARVDGATITNVEEVAGAGTRSVTDILQKSLNTGATYLLRQMGGGDINEKARTTWHDYMVNKYGFGTQTGIEGFEAEGIIPDPINGDGLNIQYANSSFGQGMTATPLQLAAALSAVVNGGTYYQPHLVEKTTHADGTVVKKGKKIVRTGIVQPQVSETIRDLLTIVAAYNNRPALREGFQVGGKTGTAQVAKPGGGYYDDRYNGMYMGYVGADKPYYVIVVRVNEPKIDGYAGSRAAAPIFASLSNMLIDTFGLQPKTR